MNENPLLQVLTKEFADVLLGLGISTGELLDLGLKIVDEQPSISKAELTDRLVKALTQLGFERMDKTGGNYKTGGNN